MKKCSKCKKNYKVLTKEGLCAYCYQDVHNEWPKEFSDGSNKK